MGINVLSRNLCGEKKVNKYNLFLKINFHDAWSDVTTLCYAKLEEALFSSKTIYIPTPTRHNAGVTNASFAVV